MPDTSPLRNANEDGFLDEMNIQNYKQKSEDETDNNPPQVLRLRGGDSRHDDSLMGHDPEGEHSDNLTNTQQTTWKLILELIIIT